jgi:4-hydroxy-3-methylbut-2-enyl diphosphate reductase
MKKPIFVILTGAPQVGKSLFLEYAKKYIKENYLPLKENVRILITSGASCPDAIVEQTIEKLSSFFTGSKQLSEVGTQWL